MIGNAVRQSAAYGLATIAARGTLLIALLVLPLILTPSEYGALSMIVTVGALVAVVVPLEVSQGLARYYAPAEGRLKKAYASSAWWFTLGMLAVFLAIGQVAADRLCLLVLGDAAYLPAFRVALVLMALNCIFYFAQNQFRWEFRTAEYVLISLVFSFLVLSLSLILGVWMDPPLVGVVAGQAIGAAAAVALGMIGLWRSVRGALEWARLKEMLAFSLPLVPASLALFVSVYASRIILNDLLSLGHVGVFTFASQIAGIATLGIVGVQAALTPLVMAHHHEPQTPAKLARFFEAFVGLALLACLALGLFAPEAVSFVAGRTYQAAGPLVMILAPAALLSQMYVFAPGFAVAKRTGWQMIVSVVSAAVAVAANWWLIRSFGVPGAAVATLLAAATFLILWFSVSQRLYPIPVRWGRVSMATAVAAGIGAAGLSLPQESLVVTVVVKAALLLIAGSAIWMSRLLPRVGGMRGLRAVIAPQRGRGSAGTR